MQIPSRILLGHARLEFAQRRADVGPKGVRMRRLERDALAYLARHLHRVVPVEELLEHVWQYHPAARTRTVHATMAQLRTRLDGLDGCGFALRTYHGQGFRLQLAAPPARLAERPLVGRTSMLRAARDWMASCRGRLLTFSGPEGSGRTRLACAVLRESGEANGVVTVLRDPSAADVLVTLQYVSRLVAFVVATRPLGLQAETVLVVDPLSDEDARRLFRQTCPDGDCDPWLRRCAGNPLALRLAAGLAAAGVSRPPDGDLTDLVDLALTHTPPGALQGLRARLRGDAPLSGADTATLERLGLLVPGPEASYVHPLVACRVT